MRPHFKSAAAHRKSKVVLSFIVCGAATFIASEAYSSEFRLQLGLALSTSILIIKVVDFTVQAKIFTRF